MSSPFRSQRQAGSINSGASSSFPEQPEDSDVFASGMSPLRPIDPDKFDPFISAASDSRKVIQGGDDPWDEIATMVDDRNLDASEPSVTGDRHIFRGSASGIQAPYQASINTAEPSSADPYTSFAPESHTSAFDHSFQSYMNIDLAWNFTEAQVVQHLKSSLEGYVRGNKLAFETKFRFGPWRDGAKAQRALERGCTLGVNKLHWNVQDHHTPRYLIIGLGDAIWKVLEAALDVNLAILDCLIEKGDVQHQQTSLLVRKKYGTCTRARLGKLRWNYTKKNPEAYRCGCGGHVHIAARTIGPIECALKMQQTFVEFREHLHEELTRPVGNSDSEDTMEQSSRSISAETASTLDITDSDFSVLGHSTADRLLDDENPVIENDFDFEQVRKSLAGIVELGLPSTDLGVPGASFSSKQQTCMMELRLRFDRICALNTSSARDLRQKDAVDEIASTYRSYIRLWKASLAIGIDSSALSPLRHRLEELKAACSCSIVRINFLQAGQQVQHGRAFGCECMLGLVHSKAPLSCDFGTILAQMHVVFDACRQELEVVPQFCYCSVHDDHRPKRRHVRFYQGICKAIRRFVAVGPDADHLIPAILCAPGTPFDKALYVGRLAHREEESIWTGTLC
ncbi:hypothetical protein HD553DRAFT_335136 [Filobasidium floriforme]|uniref:uncharacterized protein n=1 Tax=Filobasidium floriforme TaxID=5210 RepID=UPI001E8E9134|nr:uncharacterized protein HD553DRAFT_335136 [Filobasidium floriforme]KAH8085158.1 hypothetical protein HD553DRAFT_335136 [Filobasidium floriforme]